MPEPTLLGDIIQPAWDALTPEQRTCWHFWAQANPRLNAAGQLTTLYGQQAHYSVNAAIATAKTEPLLTHPPATATKPRAPRILSQLWPLQARLTGDELARRGLAYIDFVEELPTGTLVIVRQGYVRRKPSTRRPPRIRHVTIVPPLASGAVSLTDSTGYYATTAGLNRFAKIKGQTAMRRPDRPLAQARVINLLNGQEITVTIPNPYGGTRKKTDRARATQVNPDSGINHYP